MPKNFKTIEEKREYERTRKQIQKQAGKSVETCMYIVYKIMYEDEICYVGMTNNLNNRMGQHKYNSRKGGNALYDYIALKGGWEYFVYSIVFHTETTKTEILKYEAYFIRFLNPTHNGVKPYICDVDFNRIATELNNRTINVPEQSDIKNPRKVKPLFVGLNQMSDDGEETRLYSIYKIECSGKTYIGQTYDPVERFLSHKENSQNRNINALYDHIHDTGGWGNVKVTIICDDKMPKKRALLLESFFIRYHKPELNSLLPYICDCDFYRIKKEFNLP